MPGVQNKYSIDVINRFALEDDDVEDEDAENIDPFEELKVLNQKAEDAKNAPKPKVTKKQAKPVTKSTPAVADGEKKSERRSDNRGGRGGGRGRGREDRRPRQPRQGGGDGEVAQAEGAIDRPKRFDGERRRRSPRGGARGGGGARGDRRTFDRKSRDPKSSQKPFEKKEGSGAGNWGTTEDELQGQTEKVEGETEGDKNEKTEEPKEETPAPPAEPEEKTMTLEEYYASRKKSNRNPNAKLNEEKTPESAKSFEKARAGRKARMEPVDFRPAPLVQRGGDRRQRRDNRGDRRQEKKTSGYDLAEDFPSL